MAAFVRTSITRNYRALPPDATQRVSEAVWPEGENGRKAAQMLLRRPDFIIEGTTDDNTAVLNTGAEQSSALNLTDEGIAFPSGFDRDIIIEAYTRDETGPNYQKFKQTVRGGTNPTLVNGVTNLGPQVKGRLTFSSAAATAADAVNGFSVTAAATATGRYAFAIPKARRALVDSMHVTLVGTGDITASATTCHLNALTLGTGVGELGLRAGAQENVAPADTEQVCMAFDLLPVESPELAIVTATTPDEVVVGALGQASENVNWLIHVWIGELRSNAAATDSDA